MHTRQLIYISIFGLVNSVAQAQESLRPADLSPEQLDTLVRHNSAAVFFERNLNTYNWIARTTIDTTIDNVTVGLGDQYISNIIQLEGGSAGPKSKLNSTQHTTLLQLSRPLLAGVSTVIQFSSLSYSDDKAVGLSSASSYSFLGGLEYSPSAFFSLNPMAGYRWENQLGTSDKGVSYTVAGRTNDLVLDGYQLTGLAQYHQDRLDPRLLERHLARVGAQKTFSDNTRDSLFLSFSRNRREFYTFPLNFPPTADSKIESRTENLLSVTNLLDYELEHNLIASLFVTLTNRTLDRDLRTYRAFTDSVVQFDTEIREFRLDTYLQAVYRSDDNRRVATARLLYNERDEAHRAKPIGGASQNAEILFNSRNRQEQTKDNLSQRTAIDASLRLPLSLSDEILLAGTVSILRYDTPSDLNVEDRDELLTALTVATTHRISQFLDLTLSVDGILSHLVYLLKERSANNNYNRILRFSPRVVYRPYTGFTTTNTFEVLANYTVYDFEQQVALVRSFSYRQFGWIDSTSVELTRRVGLDFFSYLKLYERGQLSWGDFTERPENSFVDKTLALQARFTPAPGSQFAVGMRYFSQSRYAYEPTGKKLDTFLRSVGPTCSITWELSRYSKLALRGWYEQRQLTDGTARSLANMMLNILINF